MSGLGPEDKPNRDGSFEYYMSEPVRDNDPKGVGPFMWAALEMERLGYTVSNLFAKEDDTDGIGEIKSGNLDEMATSYTLDGRAAGRYYRGVTVKGSNKKVIK